MRSQTLICEVKYIKLSPTQNSLCVEIKLIVCGDDTSDRIHVRQLYLSFISVNSTVITYGGPHAAAV